MSENVPNHDLDSFLDQQLAENASRVHAAKVIREIAAAGLELSNLVSMGLLSGRLGASRGSTNNDGDVQKELDVVANDLLIAALRRAPVAAVVSEELREPLVLTPSAPLVVAIDPLDGSSNIDANVSIGTIFSILPSLPDAASIEAHFLRPGRSQVGAGFVIYGPQTSLVFTLGGGTHIFTLDRQEGKFRQAVDGVKIPKDSVEYAINGSNYRHWDAPIRAFVDDCIQGVEGPLKRNHNTRWIASLVAEAYRILLRGGVFLYPGDQRTGYCDGRLRQLYEANPIAMLVENAGGAAINCNEPILDVVPKQIHARVPLVFGSSDLVDLIGRYHRDPQFSAEHAPLFGKRGLMRL
jgi:fructose-1,6-bisphosphatase I